MDTKYLRKVWMLGLLVFVLPAGWVWAGDGLQVEIQNVVIGDSLRPEVTFTLKDAAGQPLALSDISAPRFILARLDVLNDRGSARYFSYTTTVQTVPAGSPNAGVSAEQATYDSNGELSQLGPGRFVYTFRKVLPADYDRTKTHTVSAQIDRTVEGRRYVAAGFPPRKPVTSATSAWDSMAAGARNLGFVYSAIIRRPPTRIRATPWRWRSWSTRSTGEQTCPVSRREIHTSSWASGRASMIIPM